MNELTLPLVVNLLKNKLKLFHEEFGNLVPFVSIKIWPLRNKENEAMYEWYEDKYGNMRRREIVLSKELNSVKVVNQTNEVYVERIRLNEEVKDAGEAMQKLDKSGYKPLNNKFIKNERNKIKRRVNMINNKSFDIVYTSNVKTYETTNILNEDDESPLVTHVETYKEEPDLTLQNTFKKGSSELVMTNVYDFSCDMNGYFHKLKHNSKLFEKNLILKQLRIYYNLHKKLSNYDELKEKVEAMFNLTMLHSKDTMGKIVMLKELMDWYEKKDSDLFSITADLNFKRSTYNSMIFKSDFKKMSIHDEDRKRLQDEKDADHLIEVLNMKKEKKTYKDILTTKTILRAGVHKEIDRYIPTQQSHDQKIKKNNYSRC